MLMSQKLLKKLGLQARTWQKTLLLVSHMAVGVSGHLISFCCVNALIAGQCGLACPLLRMAKYSIGCAHCVWQRRLFHADHFMNIQLPSRLHHASGVRLSGKLVQLCSLHSPDCQKQ